MGLTKVSVKPTVTHLYTTNLMLIAILADDQSLLEEIDEAIKAGPVYMENTLHLRESRQGKLGTGCNPSRLRTRWNRQGSCHCSSGIHRYQPITTCWTCVMEILWF